MFASSALAQNNNTQYAKLKYMGTNCNLDQNFFIGYQAIYNANIANLSKKDKDRKDWDKISGKILDYLKNPNVTIIYDETGKISFAGIDPPYSGNKNDQNLNEQEKKDNEKAAKLYGSILNTTIKEWYNKYPSKR